MQTRKHFELFQIIASTGSCLIFLHHLMNFYNFTHFQPFMHKYCWIGFPICHATFFLLFLSLLLITTEKNFFISMATRSSSNYIFFFSFFLWWWNNFGAFLLSSSLEEKIKKLSLKNQPSTLFLCELRKRLHYLKPLPFLNPFREK